MPPSTTTESMALGLSKFTLIPLVAIGLLFSKLLYTALTCPTRDLPGPLYTRFTHWNLKRAVVTGRRIFYIDALHQKYGPVVRISPTEVAIADLDAFKDIHKIGSKYLKSGWYQELVAFPKAGIFTMVDPKVHSLRRKLMARGFSKSYLIEHWEPIVREKAQLCVSKIKQEATHDVADLYNWWYLLAADVTAHLVFGESFGMLQTGHANQFMRVLKTLTIGAGVMSELPLLRLLRFVPIPKINEIFNANAYILKNAERAVEMARSRTGENNLFSKMIEACEKDEEDSIDDMDVRVEASNLIIAGTDTTGVTITYLCYAVLQRPDLQKALEAEVAQLDADFTGADLVDLPLLNAVIEETHRLYGAAPSSLPRVVPPGGSKLGGYYIPQGTTVSTQAYTFHRDATIWSDPLTFNPNRWLSVPSTSEKDDATPEALSPSAKLAFHPFGAGARSCIGVHLAKMELRYAVAFFFRECRDIGLAKSVTPESMQIVNRFLIAPKSHRCEVTFDKEKML